MFSSLNTIYSGYTMMRWVMDFPNYFFPFLLKLERLVRYYLPPKVSSSMWGLLIWPGEGTGNPLQCSCLETPMDGGAWWAAVHGVAKSWTQLSDFPFTLNFHAWEKEMATHSSVLAWRIPGTPRAWWAAVYGVAQSWTWLKWLSSLYGQPSQGKRWLHRW